MSRATSVIEINGTSYNTADSVASAAKFVDGFVRKSSGHIKSKAAAARPVAAIPARTIKNSKLVHNRAQRSSALARTGLPKPQARPGVAQPSRIKPSVDSSQEQERRSRANAVVRHRQVNRFGTLKPARAAVAARPQAIVATARPRVKPQARLAKPLPSMVASASHQRLERMLDEALVRADAHKKMLKSHSRNPLVRISLLPRWLVIIVALLIILLIGALVVWRDMPAVAIKVAGEQAHVSANLPAYTPRGYAVSGPIGHTSKAVTVDYKSTSGDGTYQLTQQSSNWDSASLKANTVSPDAQVQTSQVKGTTVYIYGQQNDATWVNNGIRYTLKNQAQLTSDQILKIAQSL